ncbi:PepSY domain-containing protein [Anoxybacillus sp. FSL W8-1294]|uniref:PepSY domain-containing protein n=2 Tax=Anoxybacillus sp. FSL W8-1294 TaxID=2954655 RepID=UPI0030D54B11
MHMRMKTFLTGIVVGATAAYIFDQWQHRRLISSEQALQKAKEAFQQTGDITGSWIQTTVEMIEKNGLRYTVYRGGVTRPTDAYECLIDAKTGTIIEARKL